MMNQQSSSVDLIVRKAIESVTGNSFHDIRPDVDLADDLGISLSELSKIMIKAQDDLEISLTDSAKREIREEAESVRDLIEIFEEEYEF